MLYVLGGVSSKENNQGIVTPVLKNVLVLEPNLEPNMPSALMTPCAVCGVRSKNERQQGNAKESITGIASVNRHQKTKIMKLNDRKHPLQAHTSVEIK